jgi:hypothetical protein
MLFICLAVLLNLAAVLQENHPKTIVVNPEGIEGPWECSAQDGIHGFFIKIEGRQHAQSSSIRIYHRQNGKEHWGYFAPGESTTAPVALDDTHFTMQFTGQTDVGPFRLDLTFDPAAQRWAGTWSACSKTGEAVLTRPHMEVAKESPMVGDWKGKLNPNGRPWFTPGSLHFRESSDGLLIAWMDRAFGDGRNGEQLKIVSAGPSIVELQTTFEIGAIYTYTGALSQDGKYLSGIWHVGNNRGMSLQAPDYFERE